MRYENNIIPDDICNSLSVLVEGMPSGVIMYTADASRSICYATQKAYKMYEFESVEEFINYADGTVNHLICEEDLNAIEQIIDNNLNAADRVLVHLNRADGTEFAVECNGQYCHNPHYGYIYVIYMYPTTNTGKFVSLQVSEVDNYIAITNLLDGGLEKALRENQFVVYLQPQYNQRNYTLYGAEALIRWFHPEKGMISPGMFIPVFEKIGLIARLDEFVLEQVCKLQRKWLDAGIKIVPVSINLSRVELMQEGICDKICGILSRYHITPDFINLEITETAVMQDEQYIISVIEDFRSRGFEIEMDDFGSGYSSLNSLKDIPVDVLKLDLKFLQGDQNDRGGRIISAIVRMAHSIGMPVICEGIETPEQASFMRSIDCFYAQGFWFDRPIPVDEYEKRLLKNKRDVTRNIRFTERMQEGVNVVSNTTNANILMDNAMGASAVVEYNGQAVYLLRANDAMYDILYSFSDEQENSFHNLFEYLNEENKKVAQEAIHRAIDSKRNSICDVWIKTTKGQGAKVKRWFCVRMRYDRGYDNIHTIFIAVDDVTKIKNQEEQYQMLLTQRTSLAAAAEAGIITIEYEDGKLSITHASEKAANMFGYNLSEYMKIIDENPFSFAHPEDYETFCQLHDQAIKRAPHHINYIYRHRCKNGTYMQVHYISQFDRVGEKICGVSILTEVGAQGERIFREQAICDDTDQMRHTVLSELMGVYLQYYAYDGRIKMANDAFYELLECTKEEFDQKYHCRLLEAIYADDKKKVLDQIHVDKENFGEISSLEYRLRTITGKTKWVRSMAKLVTDQEGKEIFLVELIPIDREKKMEAELMRKRIYDKAMFASSNNKELIFTVNGQNWMLDYASPAYLDMIGYTIQEVRELSKHDALAMIYEEDRERVRREVLENIRNPQSRNIEYRVLKSNGEYIWLDASIYFEGTPNHGIQYMSHVDITEQRKLEEHMRYEYNRMQAMMDTIPGGVVLYEMRVDGAYTVFASKGVAEMSGYTEDYFEGASEKTRSAVYKEDIPLVEAAVKKAVEEKAELNISYRLHHVDGHTVWTNMSGRLVGEQNGNPLLLAVFSDLSKMTENYRDALNGTLMSVLVSDVDSHEVLFANTAASAMAEKMYDSELTTMSEEIVFRRPELAQILSWGWKSEHEKRNGVQYQVQSNNRYLYVRISTIDWNMHRSVIAHVLDVTERVEREKQIGNAINKMPNPICVFHLSADGEQLRCIYSSQQAIDAFGLDPANYEDPYDILSQRIYPEDRERVIGEIKKKTLAHEGIRLDYRLQTPKGIRWFDYQTVSDEQSDGSCLFYTSYTDITDKMQQKDYIRDTINSIPGAAAVYRLSADGKEYRCIYASNRTREIFGIDFTSYENAYDITRELVDSEQLNELFNYADGKLARGENIHTVLKMKTANGAYRWFDYEDTVQLQPDGSSIYYGGYTDVTEQIELQKAKQRRQKVIEHVLHQALELTPEESLERTLAYLGNVLQGERAYIVERDFVHHENHITFEWCADGIASRKNRMQHIPDSVCEPLFDYFQTNPVFFMYDVENIRDKDLQSYEMLVGQNVKTLILAPVYHYDGNIVAFFGMENLQMKQLDECIEHIQIISSFIRSALNRRDTRLRLEEIGYTDQLTGVLNRHAFMHFIATHKDAAHMGAFYFDVNGLKQTNDQKGHEAGDRLIISVAKAIQKQIPDMSLFRTGGDEFVALCPEQTKEDLQKRLQALHQFIHQQNISISIGFYYMDDYHGQFDILLSEAEKAMYVEKKQYYQENPNYR